MANITDVAKKSGVCIATVTKILNNQGNVREKNRQKVLDAMKELEYSPNAAARALSNGKTNIIGVIIRSLTDPYWAELVEDIEQVALDFGYLIVLAMVNDQDSNSEKRWVKIFTEGRTDGMLLISPLKGADYLTDLQKNNFPTVLLDNNESEITMPAIVVDDVHGGYIAVKYLIECGHTEIGCIVGEYKLHSSKARLEGYKKAMKECGIDIREDLIGFCEYNFDASYQIAHEWLSRGKRPTAIFAYDDIMAMAAVNAARNLKLSIPEDLSIIGYDDGPVCSWVIPKMSSVRQPIQKIIKEAVTMLVKYIDGNPPLNKIEYILPELIVRGSVRKI